MLLPEKLAKVAEHLARAEMETREFVGSSMENVAPKEVVAELSRRADFLTAVQRVQQYLTVFRLDEGAVLPIPPRGDPTSLTAEDPA